MSCLNPITIFSPETRWLRKCRKENRSFEYYLHQANARRNLLFDPVPLVETPFDYYHASPNDVRKMSVPCGKCDLCLKRKVNDIFLMSYFEFLACKHLRNGSCWFFTLTYADGVLPKLPDGTPCFSVRHLQTFLKRLRKASSFNFKYLIVSEFGGEFGRPHYHGLIYIDNFAPSSSTDVNSFKFKVLDLVAKSWTKVEDRSYKFNSLSYLGLFDVQRVDVQFVDNPKLLRYCAKYVGKQIGAVDFDKLDIPTEFKRHTLHSVNFGADYIQFCNTDCWKKGFIQIDGYKYSIPQSLRVKVLREYYCTMENGTVVYCPTDFSLQYFENLSLLQIEEHKKLAICNTNYPKLPEWVYNPDALCKFVDFVKAYSFTRESSSDNLDVAYMLQDWQDFLIEVQKYNYGHYQALASSWKKQQEDYFLRKTHRK